MTEADKAEKEAEATAEKEAKRKGDEQMSLDEHMKKQQESRKGLGETRHPTLSVPLSNR